MEGEDNLAIERLRGSLNSDTLGAIETEGRFAAVDYGNREYRTKTFKKKQLPAQEPNSQPTDKAFGIWVQS